MFTKEADSARVSMNLASALRYVQPRGTSNVYLDSGNSFSNLYGSPVGKPFDFANNGLRNYDSPGGSGAGGGDPSKLSTMDEADEQNITYSVGIKNTTEFPAGSLYKDLIGFVFNEGDDGSIGGTYVVVPIYQLNAKLRNDFFEGKKKMLRFMEETIFEILEENAHVYPQLNMFQKRGDGEAERGGGGMFDEDDDYSEEDGINREAYDEALRHLSLSLLNKMMPEEMQLFEDKNKIGRWSELPEIMDCSAIEGRKGKTTLVNGVARIFDRRDQDGYVPPAIPTGSTYNDVNAFSKKLNACTNGDVEDSITKGILESNLQMDEYTDMNATPYTKLLTLMRIRASVEHRIQAQFREQFVKPLMMSQSSQINGNRNYVPYLTAGGYWDNWHMFGILNTVFEGRDVHKLGSISKAKVEIVKFTTDRSQTTYNIWGPNLKRGMVLYLKVMRHPVGQISFKGALKNPGELGWNGYGCFTITPCKSHVNRAMEEKESLDYYDVFGKKQRALLINIGTVKYETRDMGYSTIIRDKAIGLPNKRTGIYPTLSDSKRAMMSLPKVEVLMRRSGY